MQLACPAQPPERPRCPQGARLRRCQRHTAGAGGAPARLRRGRAQPRTQQPVHAVLPRRQRDPRQGLGRGGAGRLRAAAGQLRAAQHAGPGRLPAAGRPCSCAPRCWEASCRCWEAAPPFLAFENQSWFSFGLVVCTAQAAGAWSWVDLCLVLRLKEALPGWAKCLLLLFDV